MNSNSRPPIGLFRSKLTPPLAPPTAVQRTELVERICHTHARLILVRAPAGFGKTTLLGQCRARYESLSVATAWLTLDHADNDASRLIDCLSATIDQLPSDDRRFASGISHAGSAGDAALTLFDSLANYNGRFALILDEVELIREAGVLSLIRELLKSLPRNGHLLMASRHTPDLELGQLRARGLLLEVDASPLRFSLDETVEYFNRLRQIPLTLDELQRLHHKTDGWITGLWLASLALEKNEARHEFIANFSSSEHAVADYLAKDVFARQPEDVQQFMLRTSVVRQLTEPLCHELLPEMDCAAMLKRLAATEALLIETEDDEPSYRYHSLFAGFLRTRLMREHPGAANELHLRASSWYEREQRLVPAIDHALEGGDLARAVHLMSQCAGDLLAQGRLRLLSRWFDALPPPVLERNAYLKALQVWAVAMTRGPAEAMAIMAHADLDKSDDPEVRAHVITLRPLLLAMVDRHEEAYEVGLQSLKHAPAEPSFAGTALYSVMANVFGVMGEYGKARKLLDSAQRNEGRATGAFNMMYAQCTEGIIDMQEGRMRQASARFRLAMTATPPSSGFLSGNSWAGMLHALAVYEDNDLERALQLLHVCLPLVKDVGLPDQMIMGYIMLARIALQRGEVDRTFDTLVELEHLGYQRQLSRVVASAKLERSRVLLLQGRLLPAEAEYERANDPEVWQRVARLRLAGHDVDDIAIARARLDIHGGHPERALTILEPELRRAQAAGLGRRLLKLQLIESQALRAQGQVHTSLECMGQVLQTCCAEGFVRLVLDEGPPVARLVKEVLDLHRKRSAAQIDPLLSEYLIRLLTAFGFTNQDADADDEAKAASLKTPLTRKEIRVLELLAEGHSNTAICEELFVSDSTVRTHLRSINAKLKASSRTQAVAIARRLGLIS